MTIITSFLLMILITISSFILAIFDLFIFSIVSSMAIYFFIYVFLYSILILLPWLSFFIFIFMIITTYLFYKSFISFKKSLKKDEGIEKDEEEVKYIALFDIFWLFSILLLVVAKYSIYWIKYNYNIFFLLVFILLIILLLKYFVIKYISYTSKKYNITKEEILNFKLFDIYQDIYKKQGFNKLLITLKENFVNSIKEKTKNNKDKTFIPFFVILFFVILFLL